MYTPKANLVACNQSLYSIEKIGDNPVLVIREAAVVFSNFEGRNGYNRSITFCINPEMAQTLKELGMYVKTYTNPDGDEEYHIDVAIGNRDESICPDIAVYSSYNGSRTVTTLDFSNMNILDKGFYSRIWAKITLRAKNKPDAYGSRKGYLRSIKCEMENQSSEFDDEYEREIGFERV